MATNKTKPTDTIVAGFIKLFVDNELKRADSYRLIELMQKWTDCEPYMWGPTIIGFGSYHYKYTSGHQGDAPLLGFSTRKAEFSLYVFTGLEEHQYLLEKLGKFKMGKACLYIKKLADIEINALEKIAKALLAYQRENHEYGCHKSV